MSRRKKKFDVLVVGELNMDLILSDIAGIPQKGTEILANNMSLTLGSSSAIFASNLSTLGMKVSFVGKIGEDQFGKNIEKSLSKKDIDTNSLIWSKTSKTGITVALSYGNERAMVTHAGAMEELTENDITNDYLHSSRHLHVSSLFLQPSLKNGIVKLFQRAKSAGLTTSLDPQWDPEEKWNCHWEELLPHVDIFMPNSEEIKNITGTNNIEDSIASLKEISNIIVIKEGIKGAWIWENNEIIKQPAFLNTKVKDAIGAGDSFDAGFIHNYLRNHSLKNCLTFGALCGAINTTEYGGTTAFSNKAQFKKTALKQFKIKINDL